MKGLHPILLRDSEGLAQALERRARGYSGMLKTELLTAAHVIREYGKEKPFQQHVTDHATVLWNMAIEDAAQVADSAIGQAMNGDAIAAAIRNLSEKPPSNLSTGAA